MARNKYEESRLRFKQRDDGLWYVEITGYSVGNPATPLVGLDGQVATFATREEAVFKARAFYEHGQLIGPSWAEVDAAWDERQAAE